MREARERKASILPALVGFNILWKNQLLYPSKMLAFLSLTSLIALSQAGVLPAGVNPATCANYPFCGPNAAEYAQLARMGVPAGLTAHMAAEAKIKSQQAEL